MRMRPGRVGRAAVGRVRRIAVGIKVRDAAVGVVAVVIRRKRRRRRW
jgi:hypothetical protein